MGGIIEDYDSDKKFHALGFGALIPYRGRQQLSHNFNMNVNEVKSEVDGVDGIVRAYYKALYKVSFSGPTNLAPVINHVAMSASSNRNRLPTYHVILIMTVRTYPFHHLIQ